MTPRSQPATASRDCSSRSTPNPPAASCGSSNATSTPHARGCAVQLGYPPIDPASPLDQLLGELADPNADPHDWLFPGATHGQPLSAKTLGQRLLRHGINRAARVAALHHLIVNVPAPVLADMIGYSPAFIADTAAQLGTPWTHYAALRHRM